MIIPFARHETIAVDTKYGIHFTASESLPFGKSRFACNPIHANATPDSFYYITRLLQQRHDNIFQKISLNALNH